MAGTSEVSMDSLITSALDCIPRASEMQLTLASNGNKPSSSTALETSNNNGKRSGTSIASEVGLGLFLLLGSVSCISLARGMQSNALVISESMDTSLVPAMLGLHQEAVRSSLTLTATLGQVCIICIICKAETCIALLSSEGKF